MVWGPDDSAGLRCIRVHNINVGGLVCWEHWMPLTRQHMHNLGEQIHVALWPTVSEMNRLLAGIMPSKAVALSWPQDRSCRPRPSRKAFRQRDNSLQNL